MPTSQWSNLLISYLYHLINLFILLSTLPSSVILTQSSQFQEGCLFPWLHQPSSTSSFNYVVFNAHCKSTALLVIAFAQLHNHLINYSPESKLGRIPFRRKLMIWQNHQQRNLNENPNNFVGLTDVFTNVVDEINPSTIQWLINLLVCLMGDQRKRAGAWIPVGKPVFIKS